MRRRGRPLRRVTVPLPAATLADLRYVARTQNVSVSAVVRHLIATPTTLDRIIDRQQRIRGPARSKGATS